MVAVSCQIFYTSDCSSGSEWVSSSSERRDLKDALAYACLAATLSELHWVTQWDLNTFSSFPEFLHISQNLELGGTARDRRRRPLSLEEGVCDELSLPTQTGSDSFSLHLCTSRSSVSMFSTIRGWMSAHEGVASLNHWVLYQEEHCYQKSTQLLIPRLPFTTVGWKSFSLCWFEHA